MPGSGEWAAKSHRMLRWLRRHWGRIAIAYSAWFGLVFSLAATLVSLWGVPPGPALALGFAEALAAGWVLITLVVGVLALILTRELPQAWARLELCDGQHTEYVVTDDGAPEAHKMSSQKDERRLPAPESRDTSLAMSPDGSIIATLTRHELRIWTVDLADGAVFAWSDAIRIDPAKSNPRVVAVARCGELQVWCAYAFEVNKELSNVLWARLGKNGVVGEFSEVGDPTRHKEAYAVFLGDRLQYIDRQDNRIHEILCGREYAGQRPVTTDFEYEGLTNASVKSIDAAVVGGRTYVALLIETPGPRGDGETQTKLRVVPDGLKYTQLDVEQGSSHISLMHAPCADDNKRATVFIAVGPSAVAYDYECKDGTAKLSRRRKGQKDPALTGAPR